MSIEMYIPPALQSQVNNVKMVAVEGATVGECLTALIDRYPLLRPALLKGGKIQSGLSIFVNHENTYPQGLNKSVREGDRVYIMNILVGG